MYNFCAFNLHVHVSQWSIMFTQYVNEIIFYFSSASGIDHITLSTKRDKQLVQTLAASIRTYNYHTKAYINQKYANVL